MGAHAISQEDLFHGTIAEFTDPDEILVAARKVRDAGYTHIDAYTPFPVHGLDEAIGFEDTRIKWIIGLAGVIGFATGMGLQSYVNLVDYPMNVGGRPNFSWPSFIPVAYECTILFAGLSAFFGALALNGLPRPNHPIFNAPNFDRASQDSFFLCVEGTDPQFDKAEVKRLLNGLNPVQVAEVYGDEPEGAE
jgi:hypothetical protein